MSYTEEIERSIKQNRRETEHAEFYGACEHPEQWDPALEAPDRIYAVRRGLASQGSPGLGCGSV